MNIEKKQIQIHHFNKIPAFEGWYFRVSDTKLSLAIIVGLSRAKDEEKVFIQIFDTLFHKMEIVSYPILALQYHTDPFIIKIQQCIFTNDYIYLEDNNLSIKATLHIQEYKTLKSSLYAPTIMGPFAYLKSMECNHAILNLESKVTGKVTTHHHMYDINGICYQEKDWGTSFPSQYIWLQSNYCLQQKAILFLSCATIPLKVMHFMGLIMVLVINHKEYRFASYYGARVIKRYQIKEYYYLVIKQHSYQLLFKIKQGKTCTLEAPINGLMHAKVKESLEGEVLLRVFKRDQLLQQLHFIKCGVEIANFFNG